MKSIIVVVILAVVVLITLSMFFTVDETQYAIVTRFGDPVRTIMEPGLQMKWPAPIDTAVHFDKRLMVLDLPGPGEPAREYLTQDKKNIEVACFTCWKIQDPLRFLENVGSRADAEAGLADKVLADVGNVLAQYDLSALISTKPEELKLDQVMQQIRETCRDFADREYGIEIVDFRIRRINFPDQNRESVFARMRAERKRIATRFRSEGAEQAAKLRAETDKERAEILAKAYKEAQEIAGRADAEATRIYADAYGADPEFYEFLRTLESYEKALTKAATIVLPPDSPYLKLLHTGGIDFDATPPNIDAKTTDPPAPTEEEVDDGG